MATSSGAPSVRLRSCTTSIAYLAMSGAPNISTFVTAIATIAPEYLVRCPRAMAQRLVPSCMVFPSSEQRCPVSGFRRSQGLGEEPARSGRAGPESRGLSYRSPRSRRQDLSGAFGLPGWWVARRRHVTSRHGKGKGSNAPRPKAFADVQQGDALVLVQEEDRQPGGPHNLLDLVVALVPVEPGLLVQPVGFVGDEESMESGVAGPSQGRARLRHGRRQASPLQGPVRHRAWPGAGVPFRDRARARRLAVSGVGCPSVVQ